MRINKFVARATGLSRRAADQAVAAGRVAVNGQTAGTGADVSGSDRITLDGKTLTAPAETTTIMLNKPAGYVCSRRGQGSKTVYDLLPKELHHLKPVGRLDKDSSGLLLLTDDGDLANQLTHPRYSKEKVYQIELDQELKPQDRTRAEQGVKLDDGDSKLQITDQKGKSFTVTMSEGRNRQIRRTFQALGYQVGKLHRTQFGPYRLDELALQGYERVY
jgi:23S rRNA pseudouridine2605 synthase